ncbi:Basic helix-loop-helix transcription factor [Parasponia andersonii]|uniref:Basic helix-loop-helix transcription factor n=1 Tax=Parasponia andersonii TaxID=3476 RepID=A0A2P5BDJ0_PARAD|nr:Basic helix-loop-helix transcription factor [Parasponia andersonii]
MALETVVYNSQDPFSYGYKDFYSSMVGPTTNLGYDFGLQEEEEHKSLVGIFDNHIMDQDIHANFEYYYSSPPSVLQSLAELGSPNSSSPEASCPPPPPPPLPLDHQSPPRGSSSSLPGQLTSPVAGPSATGTGRRKRRRTRSSKNKEELENQRMTHIAVERNRRKQMNEYLAVLRSLMPPSYVQRGDQASIIGGAINFVKELEQLLQSMEGHKVRTKLEDHDHDHHHQDDDTKNGGSFSSSSSSSSSSNSSSSSSSSSSTTTYSSSSSPLAEFFTFPQYSTRASHYCNNICENYSKDPINNSNNQWATAAAADIEVTMVDSHANLKILSKKRPRQLLKMVAGFGVLRLSVLHLNVTSVDQMVLYSVSVKIEEGCQLNTVDEIASAVNQMLHRIQEEPALFS